MQPVCLVLSCLTPDFCLALDFVYLYKKRTSVCTNFSGTNTVIGHPSADSPASRAERYTSAISRIICPMNKLVVYVYMY